MSEDSTQPRRGTPARLSADEWRRLEVLVDALLDAPPDRRAALFTELSGGDRARRAELERMVAGCERDFPLLDRSAGERFASLGDEPPVRPGQVIADRYRVTRELARGGMSTVFVAEDLRHAREVAVKVVRPEFAATVGRDRFLREIRLAARLRHPHVVPLYDSGDADGLLYYVMPYETGHSLRERLTSHGPLSVDDAIVALRDVCDALAYAHARGVVHRDVKPDNVLLAGRHAMITDFGIARAATEAAGPGASTVTGVTVGTPAYMAPEQVAGEPHIDHRADLYAVGVLAYEILTGRPPFRGENRQGVMAAHLTEVPAPLATLRADVPPPLEQLVMKCLEKRAADRWQSADELLARLNELATPSGQHVARAQAPDAPPISGETVRRRLRIAGSLARHRRALLASTAAVIVALVGAALLLGWRGDKSVPTATATPGAVERVLVADFANFTSDSLLADAVSHALRIDLARSPAVRVAGAGAIATALQRMRREPNARLNSELAREVAARERIRGVIDGEVREAGGGYVISAAIIEAATGEVVDGWRETARDRAGVIPAIDRLSAAIRGRVGEKVASLQAAEPLWRISTSSLEALRTFSRAQRLYMRGDFLSAAALLEEAAQMDSTFAHAHFLLAGSLGSAGVRRGRALEATVKAYQLRDRLSAPERHAVTASYYHDVVGDLPKATEAYRNQVEAAKAGGDFFLYASLGDALAMAGDLPGAEAVLREAREVWPTAQNQAGLVQVLYRRGKVSDAMAVLREAMERDPAHPYLMTLPAELSAASGDYAAADALARELPTGAGVGYAHRIQALNAAVQGRIEDAIGHFRAMRQEQLSAGLTAAAADVTIAIGRLHLVRGDPRAALAEVEGFLARQPLHSLDALDRPYFPLARFFADAGQPARARKVLAAYDREVPQQFRGPDRWSYLRTRAAIRLAEGKPRAALADLERADREARIGKQFYFDDNLIPLAGRPELARAYDRAGYADSAVAAYERYLATHSIGRIRLDAFELPGALVRLAELYEARGDRAAAARHYLRFAELWKAADARLQPRVQAAQKRAAELTRLEPQKLEP